MPIPNGCGPRISEKQTGRSAERWERRSITLAILNVLLAIVGGMGLAWQWRTKGFILDLNSMILICLLLGLVFHSGRPRTWMPSKMRRG